MTPATGTREWSQHSINCCLGCSHACVYCYARHNALRFGRIPDGEDWRRERPMDVPDAQANRRFGRRYQGTVMFPTSHDFSARNHSVCVVVLRRLLSAGNRVLLVTKCGEELIRRLLWACKDYAAQVELRISITCLNDSARALWEPGAPSIHSRLEMLRQAKPFGFARSVSIEPLLDAEGLPKLVDTVSDLGAETIWIGRGRDMRLRCQWAMEQDPRLRTALEDLERMYAERWPGLRATLSGHPLIRWKDESTRPRRDT